MLEQVQVNGETYFKISGVEKMRPFFMSIVSHSDHWMFISSNGGLTTGRKNSEFALFPYYTDDKITELAEITGNKNLIFCEREGKELLWEPFSNRQEGLYKITRNLYKNKLGNKVIFEEQNHDLGLAYRYQWCFSTTYGFVKHTSLENLSGTSTRIKLLDGIQNILPYGVGSFLQNNSSNLVDAYKRNQLHKESGLGIYALSAIIVDKAEPSEALKANIVWSLGLEKPRYLVSSLQLAEFRQKKGLKTEVDIKAEKGAYFVSTDISLAGAESKDWMIVSDVNKNHSAVTKLIQDLMHKQVTLAKVESDIESGSEQLQILNASSDALQLTAFPLKDARHFSNTLFNIMRGGVFDNGYRINGQDFSDYLRNANIEVYQNFASSLADLGSNFDLDVLNNFISNSSDKDFERLAMEYLPLKFSRRHGDPSRPWNKFSINLRNEEGKKILDYEGNWRDIFQNWEALALSYPRFILSMIYKFMNATTFDGYNPYRVTKGGFDWEVVEVDDPWSYIGYWGDHQIIYLLKLLELAENHYPGILASEFDNEVYVYANVPYKIKDYPNIINNPKVTIDFDAKLDHIIREKRDAIGADGALLDNDQGRTHHVNFIEKILATYLAKVSNFIPEAGIWMNTQRPEWNDANNALVGNGVSMVTLYYMRRFLHFLTGILQDNETKEVKISVELHSFFLKVNAVMLENKDLLKGRFSDSQRRKVMDALGTAASDYRALVYNHKYSGSKKVLLLQEVIDFTSLNQAYMEHSIQVNRREDKLYHAYNLANLYQEKTSISNLGQMLEGQVAVLSCKFLSSQEALVVLDALKSSSLFREDQYSYLLYPNKDLPTFLEKNQVSQASVIESPLLSKLAENVDRTIIEQDTLGGFHFNGNFKNAEDLNKALDQLSPDEYGDLVTAGRKEALELFETQFDHKSFTGRSGTFYGYEGLGSIYWHMVSKLLLAIEESCQKAINDDESPEVVGRLLEHFYEVNEGIGVHKSPSLHGAFPTDPYSHTPAGKGAQQPGMTGQVKEDIITRFGELGVTVKEGQVAFNPRLLRKSEFLDDAINFEYFSLKGIHDSITAPKNSLAFTYCQVPITYTIGVKQALKITFDNGTEHLSEGLLLGRENSTILFERTGSIRSIHVQVLENQLR